MVDKDLRHLIELLAAIERDERFVLSVTAVAEKTDSVKYIAGFIEKNDIRDKQTVYEFIIPYYNRYLEKEESGSKIKKRKGDEKLKSYLYSMKIPSQREEYAWLYGDDPERKASQTKVYSLHYPFSFFTRFYERPVFEFEPITVFYGSNGSGKSTLLNVIAEKFELTRNAPYNKTDFFDDYCNLCEMEIREIPGESKIITSDDIFKKMNAVRNANLGINAHRTSVKDKRCDLQREITEDPENLRFKGMEFYDNWSEYFDAATQATSEYITKRVEKKYCRRLKRRDGNEISHRGDRQKRTVFTG